MLYYFGGKFSPFTKGHYAVLEGLCNEILQKKSSWEENDRIIIGITELKDESGIEGHQLCSSEEYRMEMIREGIIPLFKKFGFLEKYSHTSIEIVCQTNPYTYEFLEEYCKYCTRNHIEDWKKNVTLVLGEDEAIDLRNSTREWLREGEQPKWKHADDLIDFPKFVLDRESIKSNISSTKVREILYRNPYATYDEVKEYIQKPVFDLIKSNHHYWQYGYEDSYRKDENNAIKKYDITKFPRPSATVDMLIIKTSKEVEFKDQVLLIRRKNFPYKGFWALPGGFLDINEDGTLEEAANRELMEETSIHHYFYGEDQFRTYSDMGTDPRGRIVDTVFVAKAKEWYPEAGDDACDFGWFNMDELPRMAFNHRQIIEDYLESEKK